MQVGVRRLPSLSVAASNIDRSGWARWLQQQLDARGWQDIEVARRSGGKIASSQMTRWLNTTRRPDMDSIRKVCAVLDVRPVEGMVAAGYLDPEDIGATILRVDAAGLSNRELVDEIGRRLSVTSGEHPTESPTDLDDRRRSRPLRPRGVEGVDWAAKPLVVPPTGKPNPQN
jgi:hypothetical protein